MGLRSTILNKLGIGGAATAATYPQKPNWRTFIPPQRTVPLPRARHMPVPADYHAAAEGQCRRIPAHPANISTAARSGFWINPKQPPAQ